MVFFLSAILHEMLVGIPTHNLIGKNLVLFANDKTGITDGHIGVAFAGMMFQLPLIAVTAPFEKVNDALGKIVGNSIFWVSFCLVGQPLGALLYFFAWQAKYGSVSKMRV
jgi:diacylglycerol O-acyltransferase-1